MSNEMEQTFNLHDCTHTKCFILYFNPLGVKVIENWKIGVKMNAKTASKHTTSVPKVINDYPIWNHHKI